MRRRILLSTVGVAIVAVVLFAVPLGIAVARLYREEEQLRLQRRATAAARVVTNEAIAGTDRLEVPQREDETDVAIYRPDGSRLAGEGPTHGDHVVDLALRNRSADTVGSAMLATAIPVSDNERVVAAIRASEPRSVLDARVRRAWIIMGSIGIAAIGTAAFLAWLQARRLSRPVERLRNTMHQLGDGDFTVRAEPTGVPEIDEAGRALDLAAERLGTLVERERAFSADASHQLRTPITNLRLGIETALADPETDPRAALDEALRDTDRLEQTVDELLALARDVPSQREPWPLGALLDELEERWHGPLARAGRPLRVRRASDVTSITAPRAAVVQVLDVLLDNANHHGAGPVTIAVRQVAGGVSFVVEDSGHGIDGDPARVFERRNTTARGHGIGLALARSLTEAVGGRLVLERATPHPLFELFLPAAPAPEAAPV